MKHVRNSGKAIVILDGRLLVIKHRDSEGDWYSLPGGGQDPGETITAALQRECLEESGVGVDVGPLRYVREYIGANHEFSHEDGDSHQVDFVFECRLLADPAHARPSRPDPRQVGTAWLALATLETSRLYPKELARLLLHGIDPRAAMYLGDVN
jgi:8-oxo-dGTP pyrophosphatase MutT (NUDIX family)